MLNLGMRKFKLGSRGTACLLLALCAAQGAGAADFAVDFTKELGKVRRLNGLCNTARMNNTMRKKSDMLPRFAELDIPLVRYHDAASENPGYALVDISRIFPLMHLDADDPRNYIFGPTDDYILRTLATGAKVEFKLGEQIEHSERKYRVKPPVDLGKWVDVCLHIIRHYNEGWANGFHHGIRRWSIWEEPNINEILDCEDHIGTYCRMYAALSRAIRREFPGLQVGGPADNGENWDFRREFVERCRKEDLPLDFLLFDHYTRDPEDLRNAVIRTRKLLDDNGFGKTELGVSEWHYGPTSWAAIQDNPTLYQETMSDLHGIDSGVYASSVLSRLQDSPADDLFYYRASGIWGLVNGSERRDAWYAFKAFAILADKGEAIRVAAPSLADAGRYVLAAKHGGRGYVMVSNFRRADACRVALLGASGVESVKVLDARRKLEDYDYWDGRKDVRELELIAPPSSSSSLFLIEVTLSE